MDKTKFTPGEWYIDKNEPGPVRVLAKDERSTIVCVVSGGFANPQVIADAHLIAAAPKLYETLEQLLDTEQRYSFGMIGASEMVEAKSQGRDALAKARGEPNG